MFLEFDKTCKKRITPTGLTDRERGFEQTKACYLQEVIPFFKTIKDNFEGIQKALTKEVKEMKDMFEELETEVAQCAVDRKHDAIDRKNLHIAYDNLIVECLSKEVFSVATKSELNVARFAKMHVANTSVEADKDTPDFDSVFVIGKMQASLQGKDNAIRQLKKQLSKLQVTSSDTEHVEPIVPCLRNNRDAHQDYLRHLKESVETIRDIVEEAKVVRPLDRSIVSACRYTKHSQELLEYAIGTCPQGSQQRAKQLAHTPLIRKKQVNATKPSDRQDSNKHKHVVTQKTQKTYVPVPHSTGVKSYPKASGSQPKSNPKTNRIWQAKCANKVEDLPRTNNSHLRTTNRVDSISRLKRLVYYVEGLGHSLFSVAQFCDSDLEVAFRKHSCYVRDKDGVDLIKGSRGSNLYTISVEEMMKSSPIYLLSKASKNKSWLWHRCLNHLNFGTINDLARKDLV
nr:integrase, catalytic region, zinc finger, CCHC-type, peptidase aspartic, catalytic [Tanacetum cinerariifolium]